MSSMRSVLSTIGSLSDYEEVRQLGSGTYGDLFVCNRKRDNEIVCVKHIELGHLTTEQKAACWNEVHVCERLVHPNIIAYHSAFLDRKGTLLAIEMEYCDGSDLAAWLYNHQHDIDQSVALPLFVQIALALHHMHGCHVLHRDLKPKNVFVFENGRVVVGDFGISKCLDLSNGFAQTLVGSPAYMCPEIFEGQPYHFKADVWALGCILYELLTGRCPFKASSYPALVTRITSGVFDPLPLSSRPSLARLVSSMLSLRPDDRPSIREILQSPGLQRYVQQYVERAHEYFNVDAQGEIARGALRSQQHELLAKGSVASQHAVHPTTGPEIDVKTLVKSKNIATADSTLDAKAIVQLRAVQTAQRYKEKPGGKIAMDVPRCDIHLHQFDANLPSNLHFQPPPAPPLQNPTWKSRQSLKVTPRGSPPKSPHHRTKTMRGVSPPPPPVVGIIRPPQLTFHGLVAQRKGAAMEVVGTQLKSATKSQALK
ncbi:NEK protein kinase [Aphanomyces astaci]|uniref:non-specific serine/threonine protein kinase n=1 Tax=Aphanomyces astaci TaxID=112090 RepID=W4H5G0_APHAT|nr:NEK protein kinase [Aphanomyces astaci]ETV86504.1 NEK protein kinase [Aphanomyces astaci]|eukprot:XP_009823303.1 NEK protein kinase [Aphanomyces astaci]